MTQELRGKLVDLAGVTAISIVVWLWAAGQTLQSRTVSFEVLIESGEPERRRVSPVEPLAVSVEIRGSRQAVISASESLAGRKLILLTGTDRIPAQVGTHDVVLMDTLSVSPAVAPLGVDIVSVTPSIARVVVEPVR
ncbi:MAG: hypothetical protein GC172_09255 [Phycisphaera sp.]|nr:hypothetical protein [Phycisphaera sp.]